MPHCPPSQDLILDQVTESRSPREQGQHRKKENEKTLKNNPTVSRDLQAAIQRSDQRLDVYGNGLTVSARAALPH